MLISTRNNTRKSEERRKQDRRQVDFEFGSKEWIEHVKINYVAWPRTDRRQKTRRAGERRQQNSSDNALNDYKSSRLTEEEELFFDNLFKDQN